MTYQRIFSWTAVLVSFFAAHVSASPFGRNNREVTSAFEKIVAQARQSTVSVQCNGKQTALGVVVDKDGFILTKASELEGQVECRLADGRKYGASLVGLHRETDLAMLKIEAKDLPVIVWRDGRAPPVGSWLVTAGSRRRPLAVGVVSAQPRRIAAPSGVLGVELDDDKKGPRIVRVLPGTAAERAQIEVDDVVLQLDSVVTVDRRSMIQAVRRHQPGDQVTLKILRGGKEKFLRAVLGDRFTPRPLDRNEFQNHLGGPLSLRRGGFSSAIQHDTVLRPHQCGGPVVGLDGKAIGVNIARAGRVSSLALPAKVIRPLLDDLKAGRYAAVAYLKDPQSRPNEEKAGSQDGG